jgi:hypothetical protein
MSLLLLIVSGCVSEAASPANAADQAAPAAMESDAAPEAADTADEAAAQPEAAAAEEAEAEQPDEAAAVDEADEADMADQSLHELDPNNFDEDSININNEWWPLRPGTQFVYDGFTVEEDEEIPHRIVFTVTDLTKVINGVRTVVIYDRDFTADRLEEAELAFFAQDKDGNVWHFGQYRETYDETEFVGGRIWLIDLPEGAKAGIMMPANPDLESPSYSQGFAPSPFNWTDRARVDEMGLSTSAELADYDNVLVIEEYNDEEPGAFQLKYYAPGVGNFRVGWRGDDTQQEELELIEIIELDPDALAEMRTEALQLEERAYMYSHTSPAEHLPAEASQQ